MGAYWLNEWAQGYQTWNISVIRVDVYYGRALREVSFVLFGFGVQVVW